MDHFAISLRQRMTSEVLPIDYHAAKRISKQRDEQRLAMNELTLDLKHFDVMADVLIARANALDMVAAKSTDLIIRAGCGRGAEEIRGFLDEFLPRLKHTREHVQELSEVLDL